MGRWAQYDEDEHRLPEGMRRVAYDADTQKYTYQDEDGAYWEGAEGARYGELRRIHGSYSPPEDHDPIFQPDRASENTWRYLGPFFLIICLFLLGVYKMLGGDFGIGRNENTYPGLKQPAGSLVRPKDILCAPKQELYKVRHGDTCWTVAKVHGMSVQQLETMNHEADCDHLQIGQKICVKTKEEEKDSEEQQQVEGKGGALDKKRRKRRADATW